MVDMGIFFKIIFFVIFRIICAEELHQYCSETVNSELCQSHTDEFQLSKINLPNKDNCGHGGNAGYLSLKSKIMRCDATLNQFPWLAVLDYDNPKDGFRCAGSLINQRYILTAAHCINQYCSETVNSELCQSLTDEFQLSKINLPNKDNCGHGGNSGYVSLKLKLMQGIDATLNQFPWLAVLEYDNPEHRFGCAGSLINQKYILTAAHCISEKTLHRNTKLEKVRLGEYHLTNTTDCIGNDCADPIIIIDVEDTIPHPDFSRWNNENDIGLIRLSKDVKYTDFVKPICLPSTVGMIPSSLDAELDIAGWGQTRYGSQSLTLQTLKVRLYNHASCAEKYSEKGYKITEKQICAGGNFLEGACLGDSGGPLMKFDNGAYTAVGIISYGYGCGIWPDVYTQVSSYEEWIRNNIRP